LETKKLRAWVVRITIGATIFGVILSTLHQSALGALFLLAPGKEKVCVDLLERLGFAGDKLKAERVFLRLDSSSPVADMAKQAASVITSPSFFIAWTMWGK
jgi:hypothetical protein